MSERFQPCPECGHPAYCIIQGECPKPQQHSRMTEALERYHEAEFDVDDARMRLEIVYTAGGGSPTQRKEVREILGFDH